MEINKENARGRWELPAALKLATPEQLAAADKAQAELALKANSPFAALSASEYERARAARHVEEHRAALTDLDAQVRRLDGRQRLRPHERRFLSEAEAARRALSRQLAEALAATGRYDLAARAAPDRAEAARYLRWWRAIWRDDEHFCACPQTLDGHSQKFVVADIFSLKHNREMLLVKCVACRCLNVTTRRDVLAPLKEQRALRATAQAVAGRLQPHEARRVLIERKHTTALLAALLGIAGQPRR